jgi:hypothetical protein
MEIYFDKINTLFNGIVAKYARILARHMFKNEDVFLQFVNSLKVVVL